MQILEAGVIKTDPKAALADRMRELADDVWQLLADNAPDAVAIELPARRGQYHDASPIRAATYGVAVGAAYAGFLAWTAATGSKPTLELIGADVWCRGYPKKQERQARAESMIGREIAGNKKTRSDLADAVLLADWACGRHTGKIVSIDPAIGSTGWAVAANMGR